MEQGNLSTKLKNSFTQVKRDIHDVRDTQEKQTAYIAENLKRVNDIKKQAVTQEKFNLLRTNVSELDENVKKLLDIEDEIKDLDERAVTKSYFTQQFDQLSDEFDDIKNGLALLNKETITKYQMNELIADLNDEFTKVKSSIESIRNIKDSITHRELDKRTNSLNSKIDDTRGHIKDLEEKLAKRPTRKQLESDYKDLKKELTTIHNDINSHKAQLKEKLDVKEKESITTEFSKLQEKVKSKASVTELRGAVTEVNAEFRKMNNYIKNVNTIIQNAASRNELKVATTKLTNQIDSIRTDVSSVKSSAVDKKYVDLQNKHVIDRVDGMQKKIQDIKGSRVTKKDMESLQTRLEKGQKDNETRLKSIEKTISSELVTKKDASKEHDALQKTLKNISSRLNDLEKNTVAKKTVKTQFDDVHKDITSLKKEQNDIKSNYVKKSLLRSIDRYLKRLYRKVKIPIEETTFKEIESALPESSKTKKKSK